MVFRAPMKRQRSPFAWKDTCTENAEKAASVLPAPVTSKLSEVASAIPRFQPPAQKQPAPEMPPAVPWADQTSARDAPSPLPAAFPFAPPPALPEAVRTRSPVHEPPEHSPGLIASWRAMALEAKVRAQAAARKSLHLGRPGYRLSHLPPGRAETSDRLPQYLDKGDHRAELERKASLSSVHTSSSKGTCSSGKTHAVPYVKYAYV